MAGDRRRATNAAAQLPQSRGVVDRRRAGRRQWTASWALADAPRGRRGDPPAAAVRGAEAPIGTPTGTARVRPCLAAAHRRRPSLRRWLAGERWRRRSTPPAAARRVRSEAALRACAACAHASVYSENARLYGAASLAPRQPPDLISARPSAPTRMASDVQIHVEFWSEFWSYIRSLEGRGARAPCRARSH